MNNKIQKKRLFSDTGHYTTEATELTRFIEKAIKEALYDDIVKFDMTDIRYIIYSAASTVELEITLDMQAKLYSEKENETAN